MNAYDRVMAALAGRPTDRPAVLGVLGAYGGRLTDVPLPELYQHADLYVAGQIAVQEAFGLDMVMAPFDLSVIAEAFGGTVAYFDDQAPNMRRPGAATIDDALGLELPKPESTARLPMVLEATRRLAERYCGQVPVFGVVPGPVALCILILGIENWLDAALFAPEKADELLAKTGPFWLAWCESLRSAGADGLVVPEGLAAAEISTPDLYRSRFHPHVAECFGQVQTPLVFHHTGGRINQVLDVICELSNLAGVVVSSKDDLAEARTIVGPDLALIGNLENLGFAGMGAQEVYHLARAKLEQGLAGGPFLLCNSGADIPIATDPDTIRAMRLAAEDFTREELIRADNVRPDAKAFAVDSSNSPTWLCCGVFEKEMRHLSERGAIAGELVFTESMLHMDPPRLAQSLATAARACQMPTVLVFGDCCPTMLDIASKPGKGRVQAVNCAEMLLGRESYRNLLRQGAFFLLPEWAARWQEVFQTELGLSKALACEMFQERFRELVYLDTGLLPVPGRTLDACADYVGLPWRALSVGTTNLQEALTQALDNLASRSERIRPNNTLDKDVSG